MSPVSKRYLLALALYASTPTTAAHAADTAAADTETQQITSYGFDDELVHGDTRHPDGSVLRARARGARESLVRARMHFVSELYRSVEQL